MSNQQPITNDSSRKLPLDVATRDTQESNNSSNQTPRSHRGSQGRVSESPRQHQAPLFTPANMPVDILSRPALPHGGHELPWQGKHDERLPSVRSLIHLPPLQPSQPLHSAALPTPTSTATSSAHHSWPLPAPMGPPTQPAATVTQLPAISESHPAHRFDHVAVGPPRPYPPRPQSLSAVSPISYTTSPRIFARHEEVALSPDLRVPRRVSPPPAVHSHFIHRSPAAEAEQERRETVITGQGML